MEALPYMVAQVLGALGAAVVAMFLKAPEMTTAFQPRIAPAFVAEALFTYALVLVVLNTATAKTTSGNSYFGASPSASPSWWGRSR